MQKQLSFQIISPNDFNFAIAQLDQCIWDEFSSTDDYNSIVKPAVETIIPLLVQKMPAKTRKPKGTQNISIDITNNHSSLDTTAPQEKTKKPRGPNKKKQSIVTDSEPYILQQSEEPVIIAEDIKQKKPRGPNKKKQSIVQQSIVQESEESVVATESEDIKQKKPRGPNKKKQSIVQESEESVMVEDIKQKKPRGPNKKKQSIVDQSESVMVEDIKQKKPRGPKSKMVLDTKQPNGNVPDDDIVIPIEEMGQLALSNNEHNDELREEDFESVTDFPSHLNPLTSTITESETDDNEIELTEIFIQDVLYYTDSHDNWFDSHLQSVLKPYI
jgi:hypothetical protein